MKIQLISTLVRAALLSGVALSMAACVVEPLPPPGPPPGPVVAAPAPYYPAYYASPSYYAYPPYPYYYGPSVGVGINVGGGGHRWR